MQADSYKRLTTLICDRCDKEYEPTLKRDGTIRYKHHFKACSKWCHFALSRAIPRAKYLSTVLCKHCATPFKPKKEPYGRALFCSRECFKNYDGIKNPTKRLNTELNALSRIADREAKPILSMIVLKEMAGLLRIKRANAKTGYQKRLVYGQKGKALRRSCQQCSGIFAYTLGQGGLKVKCDACIKTNRQQSQRINKAVRRARLIGAKYQSVNPIRVFERDGWRCHLCTKPTPKDLRGTFEPNAPELDHIVTLADGGEHTYGNVACACRSCNQKKGARSCGQLRFF